MTSIDDVIRLLEAAKASGGSEAAPAPKKAKKRPRSASAYNKRYSAAFKRLAPKYKTKKGAWKKNGYRSCVRAAHRAAKR
tara:strand:+ start:1877 stop:2116 length:240 start_codon:yes stop_codon:yes gene_type:complete